MDGDSIEYYSTWRYAVIIQVLESCTFLSNEMQKH